MLYRLTFVAAFVLKVLMFRDAVRRGVPSHWFWLIAFVPFGEVIYFFVYPFDDPRFRARRRRWWRSLVGGGVDAARQDYRQAPSVDSKLRLALALYERGMYEEAQKQLEAILRHDEAHKDALYYLGLTRMQREDFGQAALAFERLISIRARHREHAAFYQLALCHFSAGDHPACIAALRRLDRLAPSLRSQVVLAEYLVKCGQPEDAREVMEQRRYTDGEEWRERETALREQLEQPAAASA